MVFLAEFLNLVAPVTRQRWRTNNKRGKWFEIDLSRYLVLFHRIEVVPSHDTDRLKGLTESHVVAENTVEVVFVEEREPVDSVLLVFTKGTIDGNGNTECVEFRGVEKLHEKMSFNQLLLNQLL